MKYGLILILILAEQASAEFNYARYQSESMIEAINNMEIDPRSDYFFEIGIYKYKIDVTFTGNHRETIESTKDLISKWVVALGQKKELLNDFSYEIEVSQGKKKYWLLLQNVLVNPFADEIKSGDRVSLYIMALGAVNQRAIFSINEFSSRIDANEIETQAKMTQDQIDETKVEHAKAPINTFRYLGNALVCKSDSAEDDFACFRIGNQKLGVDYKPVNKAMQDIDQGNGFVASVHPIIADDEFNAYFVVGHKDGKVNSIQMTGNYPHERLSFSTIKLTDSMQVVKGLLGPKYIERDVESINGVMWDYHPFPITVEFINNQVYSIRISASN